MSASHDDLPLVDLRADDAEIGRYGVLLDRLGVGLLIYAADGSLREVNRQARTLLGETPAVWLDENGRPMSADERLEAQVIRTGQAVHQRAVGLRTQAPARVTWCRASAFPVVVDGGRLRRVLLTISDLRRHRPVACESDQLPTHDALTGLFNPRYVQILLDEEGRRARRYGTPFTLALLAIDNFPVASDAAASHQRHRLLSEVGRLIGNSLREFDRVGRLGDNEFLLILPNVRVNEGMIGLERLRENVEASHRRDGDPLLTVSGGVTEYAGEDIAALLERVRSLLDSARQAGSNRLCVDLEWY